MQCVLKKKHMTHYAHMCNSLYTNIFIQKMLLQLHQDCKRSGIKQMQSQESEMIDFELRDNALTG